MTSGGLDAYVDVAIEGALDEQVVRRVAEEFGVRVARVYGYGGKGRLRNRIASYNAAARYSPWLVLVDLDHDFECAPTLRLQWLPHQARYMLLRVAVREVEAWLLADRERFSTFFHIDPGRIPQRVEDVPNPKALIIELARSSKREEIRRRIVPRAGSGRAVGTGYTTMLTDYIQDRAVGWRPVVARQEADSLARCVMRLQGLSTSGS